MTARLKRIFMPAIMVAAAALVLWHLKGPVVYLYDVSWAVAGLVAAWLAVSVLFTSLGVRMPIDPGERHSATFVLNFLFLPALFFLEIGSIPWPAEPGTGLLYMLIARAVAWVGTGLGAWAMLVALSGQSGRYAWSRGLIPYLILGAFIGNRIVAVGGGLLGLTAWLVLSCCGASIDRLGTRMRILWSNVPAGRRTALLLAGLYVISLAIRLPPALYIFSRCGYIGCGIDYYEAATEWWGGHFVMPMREPGTSVFFFLVMLVAGKGFAGIAIAQCMIGAAVPVLCQRVARRCFPEWAAWTVALAACVHGRMIVYSYFLGSENLQVVTTLLVVWVALRCLENPSSRRLAVLGCLFGVSAMVKPSVLAFAAPAVIIASWRRPWRAWIRIAATTGACCAAVLAAWLATDYCVSGTIHAGTRFANEFILSNHPLQVNGINWDWDKSRNAYDILREDYGFVGENPERLPNNLFISGLTTKWQNFTKVVAYRFRYPGATIRLFLRKLHQLYFRRFICPEKFDFTFMLEDSPCYWFGRVSLVMLMMIGMAGLRYQCGATCRERVLAFSVPLCYLALYSVFSPSPRNNMPALAFMMTFSLWGLYLLYRAALRMAGSKTGRIKEHA